MRLETTTAGKRPHDEIGKRSLSFHQRPNKTEDDQRDRKDRDAPNATEQGMIAPASLRGQASRSEKNQEEEDPRDPLQQGRHEPEVPTLGSVADDNV